MAVIRSHVTILRISDQVLSAPLRDLHRILHWPPERRPKIKLIASICITCLLKKQL